MSDFSDALNEVLDANDEALDKKQFARVRGKKVRAIIEEITEEEIAVAGGTGNSGGFRIQCPKALLMQRPAKGDAIEARGRELEILEVTEVNGTTYLIMAGDTSIER